MKSRLNKNNPNYKHGKYSILRTPRCIDCNKIISPQSERCKSCAGKIHYSQIKTKLKNTGKTRFIKGRVPWNRGQKIAKITRETKKKRSAGYVVVYLPDHYLADKHGWVAEHRLVISKYLNRKLKRSEIVHHINGNRADNRIENLILFKNHSEHQQFRHYRTTGTIVCNNCNCLIKPGEK
jgi:hypothetical protein